MPINTMKCPQCGARVNHVMRVDGTSGKSTGVGVTDIMCPRCKKPFSVQEGQLSQRTLDDMRELRQFNELMSDSDEDFKELLETGDCDSVEVALERADEVFDAARRALDDITLEQTANVIDADQLLQQYAVI